MSFNYNKLRGKIIEVFGSQEKFSEALGISNNALSKKLNNKTKLSQKEIVKWAEMLGIPDTEYKTYFFDYNGQSY